MSASTTKTAPIERSLGRQIRAAVISLTFIVMAGCGGGGGGEGSAPAAVNTAPVNSFAIAGDDYGIENANYLSATKSSLGIVLRAAVASSMTDPDYKTVTRIDIAPGAAVAQGVTYPLAAGAASPAGILFLNGHGSTLMKTTGGSITFSRYGGNAGDRISGTFAAVVRDDGDPAQPSYNIAGSFDFVCDSFGALLPAPASLALSAQPGYQARCASCHALGSYDQSASGAPDLALMGGRMNAVFSADLPGHQGVSLSAGEIAALKVLLNTN